MAFKYYGSCFPDLHEIGCGHRISGLTGDWTAALCLTGASRQLGTSFLNRQDRQELSKSSKISNLVCFLEVLAVYWQLATDDSIFGAAPHVPVAHPTTHQKHMHLQGMLLTCNMRRGT